MVLNQNNFDQNKNVFITFVFLTSQSNRYDSIENQNSHAILLLYLLVVFGGSFHLQIISLQTNIYSVYIHFENYVTI